MERQRVKELLEQKYHCSQIMMKTGLELRGEEGTELVRAMNGLAGGLGGCGRNCGALTGACAMFGLFAGRGLQEEEEDPDLKEMVGEFLAWFEDRFGSPDCSVILKGDFGNVPFICPGLIMECSEKAEEILQDFGFIQ